MKNETGIKIKLVEIDGEKRVPPECMRLLAELAKHRDGCRQCFRSFYNRDPIGYCPDGMKLLKELASQPEVEPLYPPTYF